MIGGKSRMDNSVNYKNFYHEIGTDIVYFFSNNAFDDACKKYEADRDLYGDIDRELNISESSIRKYRIRKAGSKSQRTPGFIEECKALGELLCGNEYAFLCAFRYEKGIKEKVKRAHMDLYDILASFDASKCFNNLPDPEDTGYYDRCLDEIQKKIRVEFLGEESATKEELLQLVEETRIFIKRCEIPGVVDSWLDVNPNLRYYDAVFEIMETDYSLYEQSKSGE